VCRDASGPSSIEILLDEFGVATGTDAGLQGLAVEFEFIADRRIQSPADVAGCALARTTQVALGKESMASRAPAR
jgi:hypothetical protein